MKKTPQTRLGRLRIETPVVLAPMAGLTHLPFRRVCRRYGSSLVYTEMTSVEGLVRGGAASWRLLETDPSERPVVAHLYGHQPERFAEAAAQIEALGRFDAIDINAGCPVPKIVRRGAGAGLIRDLPRLEAVVRAVRDAVCLPVLVKTRIGSHPNGNAPEDIVRAVANAGADAIAIHARFTIQRHGGKADWPALARIKAFSPIPVIGNGGIRSPAQAKNLLNESGVDAVMIGRGALGTPWIFEQAADALAGKSPREIGWPELESVLREHLEGLVQQKREDPKRRRPAKQKDPEETAARLFRPHLIHYMAGFRGALDLRRHLNDIHSVADILAHIERIRTQQP